MSRSFQIGLALLLAVQAVPPHAVAADDGPLKNIASRLR